MRLRFYQIRGSSQIEQVGYDTEAQQLFVKFTGVSLYRYDGVPALVVTRFMFSDSLGKFLNENIKGVYEFEKLGPQHEAFTCLLGDKVTA